MVSNQNREAPPNGVGFNVFTVTPKQCCGQDMYRCHAKHTDGKNYLHCTKCTRNVEVTA